MSGVVITGLGTVHASGAGATALLDALRRGQTPATEVERPDGYHAPGAPRLALLARDVDLSQWLPRGGARRLSLPSKYAVAATAMALEGAGLSGEAPQMASAPVALATAFGTAGFAEELVRAILLQGPEAASPFHFSESVANAPAAQVAIRFKARGANVAVTQREAGALQAVILGAREILRGRSSVALVGVTEEVTPLVHAALGRFAALAGARGRPEVARPFDQYRDGFVAAEGATVLVLEEESSARQRGARALARLRAWERGFDPSAPPWGWGRCAGRLAARLSGGLERAGLQAGDLDAVVSGASGSRQGDRAEAHVLKELFGSRGMPPVVAPKGALGEYGGGHLAAAVLAAGGERLGATAGFRVSDPELGIVPHDGSAVPPPRRLLVSSLAAGGAASWLVLEAAEASG
jgi:3-oxoacyl-(acyl-carrier-protein) synthase